MPTGHTASTSLSDTEIDRIATDLEAGRLPRVWFTVDAVGMPAGQSGKVVALAARTEPDFLQVRPTGSHDTLAFSPTELTFIRPPRRRILHQHTHHDGART